MFYLERMTRQREGRAVIPFVLFPDGFVFFFFFVLLVFAGAGRLRFLRHGLQRWPYGQLVPLDLAKPRHLQ